MNIKQKVLNFLKDSPESSYEEVKLEYDMQNKMLSNKSAIAFSRKMLMAAVTGLRIYEWEV